MTGGTIAIRLELSDEQLDRLAQMSRLLRVEPRKRWTVKEKKEHARDAARALVMAAVDRRPQ
jgi:hypothetical protein